MYHPLPKSINGIAITQSKNSTFGLASTRIFRKAISVKDYFPPPPGLRSVMSFGKTRLFNTLATLDGTSSLTNPDLVAFSTPSSRINTSAFAASVK
jgi:hypothetical protein